MTKVWLVVLAASLALLGGCASDSGIYSGSSGSSSSHQH